MAGLTSVSVILLGLGNVGGTLLRQVLESRDALALRSGLRVAPVALADSSAVVLDQAGLADDMLHAALAATRAGQHLTALPSARPLSELPDVLLPGTILADLTASPVTVPMLRTALNGGCSVVLANKIPLGGPWSEVRPLFEHPRLRYEATVGAGLPVIATLRSLLDSGDQVTGIEGCLSGTLGYLCAELEQGTAYSTAVRHARHIGYTEPDPREDLSGMDVARKALILARTAGWPLEVADLTVEALYPADMAAATVAEFMGALARQDAVYAKRVLDERETGHTLRYVARVTATGGSVGLVPVPRASSLGSLRGPGNHIALYTKRYAEIPLVIAGPGAGPEVTAAGVLSDIIALARPPRADQ